MSPSFISVFSGNDSQSLFRKDRYWQCCSRGQILSVVGQEQAGGWREENESLQCDREMEIL
jgi:hypothetical protein